jgi:hypothetical protein
LPVLAQKAFKSLIRKKVNATSQDGFLPLNKALLNSYILNTLFPERTAPIVHLKKNIGFHLV